MAIDRTGNIYLAGGITLTVDVDPGPAVVNLSSNDGGTFILKLDPDGHFLWAKQIAGNLEMNAICTDRLGNILLTGTYYYAPVDFDPGPGLFELSPAGYSSAFILKLDNDGIFRWAKSIGGANFTRSYGICSDDNAAVYTTGAFPYTADFDPGPGVFNLTAFFNPAVGYATDAYISKLDSSGNFVWANRLGGIYDDAGLLLNVNKNGTLYAAGSYAGEVTFFPTAGTVNPGYSGSSDAYICRINNNGAFEWAKRIGGPLEDGVKKLEFDAGDNLYLLGNFTGTADFSPDTNAHQLTAVANSDIYVCKLDSNGIYQWARQTGGSDFPFGSEAPGGMVVDRYASIYCCGRFDGTSDFDPDTSTFNLTCNGFPENNPASGTNTYMFKWRQCNPPPVPANLTPTANLTICSGSSTTLQASGTGTLSWYNASSGGSFLGTGSSFTTPILTSTTTFFVQDSTCSASNTRQAITVNVNQPSVASLSIAACAPFTLNNQTYSNSGNYTQTLTNAAGCDSTLNLSLQLFNAASTSQDVTICAGTVFWVGTNQYTVSGTYVTTLATVHGCDSIVTTHLTVEPFLDTAVTFNGIRLSALASGVQYQWLRCNNGYQPVAGATNQQFYPLFNGSYAVEIKNSNCADTSSCIAFWKESNQAILFPNPTSGPISLIIHQQTGPVDVYLYNSLGQLLFQKSKVIGSLSLDLTWMSNTVYFLKLMKADLLLQTFRVIKR